MPAASIPDQVSIRHLRYGLRHGLSLYPFSSLQVIRIMRESVDMRLPAAFDRAWTRRGC